MSLRVVSDYQVSRKVIASRDFSTFRMADEYRLLAARLGHDFSASIALLDRLPTFMEGADHKRVRRAMARKNDTNKVRQLAAVERFLQDFAKRELRPDNTIDLMSDFALPLYRAFSLGAKSADRLPPGIFDVVQRFPALFAANTPLKERYAIDAALVALTADAEGDDDIFDDLALLVLGIYPLTGGLALTLHATFAEQAGASLSAIDWPTRFATSALHYVDRICVQDALVAGQAFTTGERVRCMVQVPEWGHELNHGMTFGTGAHTCLGRTISEFVWTMVTRRFAEHDVFARAEELTLKPNGEPFELPSRAIVTFTAAA